jgi:hypothetical protein
MSNTEDESIYVDDQDLDRFEEELSLDESAEVKFTTPCRFITGPAGTGKTYQVKQLVDNSPRGYELCATTGIAAVNMGPGITTIHSLLKFFNYQSMRDAYMS